MADTKKKEEGAYMKRLRKNLPAEHRDAFIYLLDPDVVLILAVLDDQREDAMKDKIEWIMTQRIMELAVPQGYSKFVALMKYGNKDRIVLIGGSF